MIEQIETTIVAFLLGSVLTYFGARWSKIIKKIDCLECGVQAILRDRMVQMHRYYSTKQLPVPQRDVESFESMYQAYKMLNGNGYVDDVRHDIVDVMQHEPR